MVVSRFEGESISEEWIVSELMGELLLNAPGKKWGRLNDQQTNNRLVIGRGCISPVSGSTGFVGS